MELINQFLDHLSHELNYSMLTVSAYRTDLMAWADFATAGRPELLHPLDVTTSDLRQWIGSLGREGRSPRTIRRKASSLRSFFRFLMCHHGLKSNPASALTLAKIPKDLPVYIRPDDTARVLDDAPTDTFAELRDRLIIDLLYSTGIRCSELTGLLDRATDTSRGELKVLGKRNKERIIPIGPELCQAIEDYRLTRDSSPATAISPADPTAPLLVRDDGLPLYRKFVYNVVHRTLSEEGVHASRLSPHVLRHSFATDMLNSGAPLTSVQTLLGHQSLTSTQVYTHVTYSELKHNYQLAHPRALKKGGKNGN
ncbi:tyrosine-type recombinase/integrase [Duncaniella muris]|uniref:Recombinase n=1 Tax=Duncaniella muris TaxID=2094150 RepID=A0A2V1IMC6_9BACT|nr:tyrosine-type recombinase/integrase [Duncaniella muris]PWB01905.1 recombinase [Duncaniella muris]